MNSVTTNQSALVALQSLNNTMSRISETRRGASAPRIQDASSDFSAFTLASSSLSSRASELMSLKDAMGQQASTLNKDLSSVTQISSALSDMKTSLANVSASVASFKGGGISTDELSKAITQYQASYEQALAGIDKAAGGSNLLTGGKMDVVMNERGTSKLTVQGSDVTAKGLKLQTDDAADSTAAQQDLSKLASAVKDKDDTAAIDAISKELNARGVELDSAINTAGALSNSLQSGARSIEAYQSFTSNMIDTLQTSVGAMVDADLSVESARLQSLQTKQQLGMQALSIANQAPQALLKLFGG